jgi:hypothetical protein
MAGPGTCDDILQLFRAMNIIIPAGVIGNSELKNMDLFSCRFFTRIRTSDVDIAIDKPGPLSYPFKNEYVKPSYQEWWRDRPRETTATGPKGCQVLNPASKER